MAAGSGSGEGGGDRAGDREGGEPWWEQGEEPDYRATLANERTFLAWTRTGLALLIGALAAVRLLPSAPAALRLALALYLTAAGLAAQVAGYLRWRDRQHRMRLGRPLGHSPVQLAATAGFVVLTGLVAVIAVTAAGH
jgi:putative membrane protein